MDDKTKFKLVGAAVGLIIGLVFVWQGFLGALIVGLLVVIGFFTGKYVAGGLPSAGRIPGAFRLQEQAPGLAVIAFTPPGLAPGSRCARVPSP